MTTEQIVNAIRNATNGTFVGEFCTSTLMGWMRIYDEEGREVTCDPNYKESTINIAGNNYTIIRKGWEAYIFKPEYTGKAHYTTLWADKEVKDKMILTVVDLQPDYVKAYWERHKNDTVKFD